MGFQWLWTWFGTWCSGPDGLTLLMSEVTGQNGEACQGPLGGKTEIELNFNIFYDGQSVAVFFDPTK